MIHFLYFNEREDMFGLKQAHLNFDNGYTLSIVTGDATDSSDNTFEVALIHNDHVVGEPYGNVDKSVLEHIIKIVSAPNYTDADGLPDIYQSDNIEDWEF